MDDLNDDPQEIAEDIIKQATNLGFKQEATVRIVRILETYHQLQNDIAESKEQKANENDIVVDGFLAWKTKDNHQKEGPYCARCYIKDKELFQLIDMEKGLWECAKCGKRCRDSSFERQHPKRANNDYDRLGTR